MLMENLLQIDILQMLKHDLSNKEIQNMIKFPKKK